MMTVSISGCCRRGRIASPPTAVSVWHLMRSLLFALLLIAVESALAQDVAILWDVSGSVRNVLGVCRR